MLEMIRSFIDGLCRSINSRIIAMAFGILLLELTWVFFPILMMTSIVTASLMMSTVMITTPPSTLMLVT